MRDPGSPKWASLSGRALGHLGAGLASLAAGMTLGAAVRSEAARVLFVILGFLGLIGFFRRSFRIWDVDSFVFETAEGSQGLEEPPPPLRSRGLRRASGALRLVAVACTGVFAAAAMRGQQTVFNIPTADVLDRGKLYLETDWLWRPFDPRFANGEFRAVYGIGSAVELGINFSGFVPDGPSSVAAVPNVKWQPYRGDLMAVTTGAFLRLPISGRENRRLASLAYLHSAVKLPIKTRLTAGAWLASSGYAGPQVEKGGLFALEKPVTSHLTLAGDWYTGKSGLGYLSLGLIASVGGWVLYASYAFKNGDSRASGLLLELGFAP